MHSHNNKESAGCVFWLIVWIIATAITYFTFPYHEPRPPQFVGELVFFRVLQVGAAICWPFLWLGYILTRPL